VETIATGSGIREIERLRKRYGRARLRKRKGTADIELPTGEIVFAEVHWYEASESGEDYLYPKNAFVEVALPQPIRRAVLAAA
jgi:hypothetical protein